MENRALVLATLRPLLADLLANLVGLAAAGSPGLAQDGPGMKARIGVVTLAGGITTCSRLMLLPGEPPG